MKVGRIVGVALLVLLVLYVLLLHAANPEPVSVPWLYFNLQLPVSYVVALGLLVGFLAGWLPARLLAWRRGRDLKKLDKRLRELEPVEPTYPTAQTVVRPREIPVIPDRSAQPLGEQGSDPYDEDEAG